MGPMRSLVARALVEPAKVRMLNGGKTHTKFIEKWTTVPYKGYAPHSGRFLSSVLNGGIDAMCGAESSR